VAGGSGKDADAASSRRGFVFAAAALIPGLSVLGARKGRASMADVPRERLVILEPGAASAARAKIEAVAAVTQALEPRLLLIRADPKAAEAVARIAGVAGVHDGPPAELPSDLTPAERTFVAAWAARGQPKTRPGEGLPWDAPGHLAPDGPGKRQK
jgi:hypothetical protein